MDIEQFKKQQIENSDQKSTALDQFKAAYFLIKGKRDTDIRLFDQEKSFSIENINDLYDKIISKLRIHTIVGSQMSVVVGLSNKDVKSFGNWEEFQRTDWKIPYRTEYITLEWDFNVLLPNLGTEIPQQHNVRIRIGREMRPSEMIQIVFAGGQEENDLDELNAQMCLKIDFVNFQLCSDLKNIVTEWYESLPKANTNHRFEPKIVKHQVKIEHFIILTWLVSGIIVSNYLARFGIDLCLVADLQDLFKKLFLVASSFAAILYLFYSAGKLFADRVIRKTINQLRKNPMIRFTSGDNNAIEEIQVKNNSLIKNLGQKIFFSFLSIPASWLFSKVLLYIIKYIFG